MNVHMTHGLGDDVVIRHKLVSRRITVLQKPLKHGDLFGVSVRELPGCYLSTHLVHSLADELPCDSSAGEF